MDQSETNRTEETNRSDRPIRLLELRQIGDQFKARIEGREPMIISDELVHRYRLKAGVVITPAQFEQLEREAELAQADRTAARLLAAREHSAGQLRAKLAQRKYRPEAIKATVQKYVDRGIVDDAQFAYKQAAALLETNPAGREFVIQWLRRKHIPREMAEETVKMLLADHDETELAVTALERKWKSIKQFDVEKARTRAYNYLSRRGIGYSAAKAAFEQLRNRDKNESQSE